MKNNVIYLLDYINNKVNALRDEYYNVRPTTELHRQLDLLWLKRRQIMEVIENEQRIY